MRRPGDNRLKGSLAFLDAGLALPDWALQLTDIEGTLKFTLDGVSARGIRAEALGRPVGIDVLALEGGGTRVRATARLSPRDIERQLPTLPLQMAEGRSRFVVDVDVVPGIAPAGGATMLRVGSDLEGIRVALPEPLGKAASEGRPLAVRIPLGGAVGPGSLSYGDTLAARFSTDGRRIGVALGGATPRLPTNVGLRVTGRLDELDTAEWEAAIARLMRPGAGDLPRIDADLTVARITRTPHALEDVALKLTHSAGEWRGDLQAQTVAGRFIVPADLAEGPIVIDLDRLILAFPISDENAATPVPDTTDAVDPTTFPALALEIDQLRVNNAELGALRLDASRQPGGLSADTITLTGGALEMDAQARWTKPPDGIGTRLSGRASTKGLGDLLVEFGYSRQLEEAPGEIEFTLGWPGDPSQAHRTTVTGQLSLAIGAGRLVELDPGVTRVVGLLNLNALTRRLRLDFSDFYKKGHSFDRITGAFEFDDGVATTDDLKVLGPTGRIDVQGSADLSAGTLDQKVRVTPNLDATLPIASAIAGGPLAGVAVLVAQEVLSDEMDAINRFEYAVTGDWADPKIRQLDSGGPLSKLLGPLRRGGGVADAPDGPTAPTAPEGDGSEPGGAQSIPVPEAEQSTPDVDDSPLTRPFRGLLDLLKSGEVDTDNLLIDQD